MSKGKQALAALSPEVRAAMYAEVKADFRQRGTNLGNESNQFLERMIENAMIWELTPEQEEHSRSDRRINQQIKGMEADRSSPAYHSNTYTLDRFQRHDRRIDLQAK
jgi:hypothetical protein